MRPWPLTAPVPKPWRARRGGAFRSATAWRLLARRARASSRAVLAGMPLAAALLLAPAGVGAAGYPIEGRCDGWPRADVEAPGARCVAVIVQSSPPLRMPRRLLQVGPNRFWITDLGGWDPGRGRLLELSLEAPAHAPAPTARLRVLARGLDRPHGLALGPDGQVYVAEAGTVWRTPVAAELRREVVLQGLPADGAHPLKEIAFGPPGRLYVGIGSASDACRNPAPAGPSASVGAKAKAAASAAAATSTATHAWPCPETTGARPRAAVYELKLEGPAARPGSFEPFATGLRNSLALAWEPGAGALWQGENSIDYPESAQPPEELNRLLPGQGYGWPACVGDRQPARGYGDRPQAVCARSQAPQQLWPAHAAPLQLLFVPAGSASPWAGQMLAAWHGYRPAGRRVVAFALQPGGMPAAQPRGVLAPRPGSAFAPAPAGLAIDRDGHLWIVDDRHGAVLRVMR